MTSKPYLVLHGELDPQTSYGFFLSAANQFGSNGISVSVPYGPHQPTAFEAGSTATVGTQCSLNILIGFLGGKNVPTECLATIPPPDFEVKL